MTSSSLVIAFLLQVLLSFPPVSPQSTKCTLYLKMNWIEKVGENVTLLLTNKTEDVLECMLENICVASKRDCYLLKDCIYMHQNRTYTTPMSLSHKCRNHRTRTVHVIHLMCLFAAVFAQDDLSGCKHDFVCPMFRREGRTAATTPGATTEATTTEATTTFDPMVPSAEHDTQVECTSSTVALLAVSWSLTLILPLLVYLVMRRQRIEYLPRRFGGSSGGRRAEDSGLNEELQTDTGSG